MHDCFAAHNGRRVDFINPSATADRNFSNSSTTVEFHFFHWSDYSHLGDFSELVAALLNREGNSTFCHCTFLAHRGPLLQPWRSDTILSRPRPSAGEEDATNIIHNRARRPMKITRKTNAEIKAYKHTQMPTQSYSGSKTNTFPALNMSIFSHNTVYSCRGQVTAALIS